MINEEQGALITLSVFVPREVMLDHFDGDERSAIDYFQWAIEGARKGLIADSEKRGAI